MTTARVPALAPKGFAMFYVLCPCCASRVEVPSDAIGPERQHLWNVIVCETCDASFDYVDEDIQTADDPPDESVT